MSEFKVEKGIEIPKARHKKYPFREMEIGDSFFVPTEHDSERSYMGQRITSMGRSYTGYKFMYRQVEGGVRVWRINHVG